IQIVKKNDYRCQTQSLPLSDPPHRENPTSRLRSRKNSKEKSSPRTRGKFTKALTSAQGKLKAVGFQKTGKKYFSIKSFPITSLMKSAQKKIRAPENLRNEPKKS